MGGVTVTVVHVVDVVAVLHHRVAAIRPVLVFVTFMDDVHHVVALVVMPVMRPVDVAVVKVVRVVLVGKRDVTALGAVLMRMIGVSPMRLHVFDLSWAASYCKPPQQRSAALASGRNLFVSPLDQVVCRVAILEPSKADRDGGARDTCGERRAHGGKALARVVDSNSR